MRRDLIKRVERLETEGVDGSTARPDILVTLVEQRADGRMFEQDGIRFDRNGQHAIDGPWREVNHAGT